MYVVSIIIIIQFNSIQFFIINVPSLQQIIIMFHTEHCYIKLMGAKLFLTKNQDRCLIDNVSPK
jgi:hypothetical protein